MRSFRFCLLATAVCTTALAVASTASAAPSRSPVTGTLTKVTSLGTSGVSVHAEPLAGGGARLYYSSTAGGTAVDDCTAAGSCTRQGVISGMSDLTVVTLKDGTRRCYFVQQDPSTQVKALFTAVLSGDGLSCGEPIALGIASRPGARAWGVPDSVVLPDGRVRLYWVDEASGTTAPGEVIASATSTDTSGTSFVRDAGYRFTGGVVDFEVLRARTGAWTGIASTSPGQPPQRLVLATSDDGLRWKVNRKGISPSNANYLDPSGFPVGKNTYRVYFSRSPLATPFDGFVLQQGLVTFTNPR